MGIRFQLCAETLANQRSMSECNYQLRHRSLVRSNGNSLIPVVKKYMEIKFWMSAKTLANQRAILEIHSQLVLNL